jgi:heat shock protein HslJ
MNWKILIIIFSILILPACAENSSMGEMNIEPEQTEREPVENELVEDQFVDSDLVNKEWFLYRLNGEPLIERTNIILSFEGSSFSGFAGCNAYGGPVETAGEGEIKFGEIASQAEDCLEPEGVLEQEITYLDLLIGMAKYNNEKGELTLSNPVSGQRLIYTLREPLDMDPELLEDSSWILQDSDDFPLIEDSKITLAFSNGNMEGFAGCRAYQGKYIADEDKIQFPMMIMLGDVCEGEDLLIQEEKFTTALELATNYQVQDDRLTLFLATGETILFERQE